MFTPLISEPTPISPNPKWKNIFIWGLIVSILAVLITSANSCTTPKNAAKKAEKIMDKFPEQVLPILRKKAPCITVKYDTTFTSIDTVINIDCPETDRYKYFTDTIFREVNKTIRIPYKVTLPSKVITKYIEDSAKIKELTLKLEREIIEKEEVIKKEKETADKLNKARKTRNWLWLILILSAIIATRKTWMQVLGKMVNPIT